MMKPELALWMGVLEQAMNDAKLLIRRAKAKPELWSDARFRNEVNHLKRWFRAKSQEPGGFGFICDISGVESDQALNRINEQYLRHMTPEVRSTNQQITQSGE